MKKKGIYIIPVISYGDEALYAVKDNFITTTAEKIVMVPALEGMIEKRLTKAGALNLYAKYKEIVKEKPAEKVLIVIPEEVNFSIKSYRFLQENTNIIVSPKNPMCVVNHNIIYYESKILIVDLHNYYHRIFYSSPEEINVKNEVITLKNHLQKFLKWINTNYDYVIFANESPVSIRKDEKITSFLEKYGFKGGYKGKRKEKEKSLLEQIDDCNNYLKEQGYTILEVEGYEADDVIMSIVKKIVNYSLFVDIHIFTSDKDLFQTLKFNNAAENIQVKILYPKEKKLLDINGCLSKFGVMPNQILDLFALMGDSSDNIPGAKGIGQKTAVKLINKFNTVANLFLEIDEIEDEKVKNKLLKSKPLIMVSRDLVYLREHLFESAKIENLVNKI